MWHAWIAKCLSEEGLARIPCSALGFCALAQGKWYSWHADWRCKHHELGTTGGITLFLLACLLGWLGWLGCNTGLVTSASNWPVRGSACIPWPLSHHDSPCAGKPLRTAGRRIRGGPGLRAQGSKWPPHPLSLALPCHRPAQNHLLAAHRWVHPSQAQLATVPMGPVRSSPIRAGCQSPAGFPLGGWSKGASCSACRLP